MEDVNLIKQMEAIVAKNCEELMNDQLDEEKAAAALKTVNTLTEQIIELDKLEFDKWERTERRRMDEEKSKQTLEIERSKVKQTFGKFASRMAELIVPIAVTALFYTFHQSRAQYFEQTGVMRNQSSKDLHIPKYWK